MALKVSNHFMKTMADAYLVGKTVRCLAVASNGAWDPGAINYDKLSDCAALITAHEFNGANYARPTLAGITITESDVDNNVKVDFTDPVIASLGAGTNPIEGWFYYIDGADDDNRFFIQWDPYTSPEQANGNDFQIKLHADGLFVLNQGA